MKMRGRQIPDQDTPGRCEGGIQPPAPGHCPPKRAGQKNHVIQQRQHRRSDHHLLGSHAEQADRGGGGVPSQATFCCAEGSRRPADQAVKHQQIKQADQRFGPLDHIRDGFGLEWVDDPDQGDDRGQGSRGRGKSPAEAGQNQCPPHDSQEQQSRQNVDRHIDQMVAPDVQPAESIVQRQRKADHGPSADQIRLGRKEHPPERPEVANRSVIDDPTLVVEHEFAMQAVAIDDNRGDRDRRGGEQRSRPAPNGRSALAWQHRRLAWLWRLHIFKLARRPRRAQEGMGAAQAIATLARPARRLSENRHIFRRALAKGVGSRFRHDARWHYGSFSGRNRLPTPFATGIPRRGRFLDSLLARRPADWPA